MNAHINLTSPYLPLIQRIQADGHVTPEGILRVDSFLNHRIEPDFIYELAEELARRLSDFQPNLVLTSEASGIAPAFAVAHKLKIPVLFAKKYGLDVEIPPTTFVRELRSPTKGNRTRLVIARSHLNPGLRTVLVDDFLANGSTAEAIAEIAKEAGSPMIAAGFVVEKRFQGGRLRLERIGVSVSSLAQVTKIENKKPYFEE